MLIEIDKCSFKFELGGLLVEKTTATDWYATEKIDGVDFEICFSEKIFNRKNQVELNIDWNYIKKVISNFLSNRAYVLDKAHSALMALNKVIGAWSNAQMEKGFYDLICLEILRDPSGDFQLTYKLIGHTNENYFIDSAYATWYVTFSGKRLIGVRREVL